MIDTKATACHPIISHKAKYKPTERPRQHPIELYELTNKSKHDIRCIGLMVLCNYEIDSYSRSISNTYYFKQSVTIK